MNFCLIGPFLAIERRGEDRVGGTFSSSSSINTGNARKVPSKSENALEKAKTLTISKCSGMICILPIVREVYDKGCQTEEEEEYQEDDDYNGPSSARGERDRERENTQTPRRPKSASSVTSTSSSASKNLAIDSMGSGNLPLFNI